MIIHFFTKDSIKHATARHRGYFIAEELEKVGYRTIVHMPPTWRSAYEINLDRIKESAHHFKIPFFAKKGDLFYLVRTVYQIDFFLIMIFFKIFFRKRFIFDFDDAIFLGKNYKNKRFIVIKMRILTQLADAVVVGSHSLADWAQQYNKKVYIIPTSVPYERYSRYSKKASNNSFVIGWIGIGPNHLENLKILVPVFKKLIQDKINFKFVLIGALQDARLYQLFKNIKGLSVEFVDNMVWQDSENIAREIQKFDIGVMPLCDNEWNRGKCSFKAIEYMACGVPAIVSPVGENIYLINNGVNGFLADPIHEWVDTIKKLYSDSNLLNRIGVSGKKTIQNDYSTTVSAQKLIKIINSIK